MLVTFFSMTEKIILALIGGLIGEIFYLIVWAEIPKKKSRAFWPLQIVKAFAFSLMIFAILYALD